MSASMTELVRLTASKFKMLIGYAKLFTNWADTFNGRDGFNGLHTTKLAHHTAA